MNQNENKGAEYDFYAKLPLKKAIPLGMQHVLAMFVGNLTPLLIITGACAAMADGDAFAAVQVSLLQNAMLIAGIVTLIQMFGIGPVGGKVPIIMGTSSGFIGVFQSVAAVMGGGILGYGAIMGASIIGGLFETVLGFLLKPPEKVLPVRCNRYGCTGNRSFSDQCRCCFFWRWQLQLRLWFYREPADRTGCAGPDPVLQALL